MRDIMFVQELLKSKQWYETFPYSSFHRERRWATHLHTTPRWWRTSRCHGSHRGTRSGTSRASWHKWIYCHTPQSHLHTHQYLQGGATRHPYKQCHRLWNSLYVEVSHWSSAAACWAPSTPADSSLIKTTNRAFRRILSAGCIDQLDGSWIVEISILKFSLIHLDSLRQTAFSISIGNPWP